MNVEKFFETHSLEEISKKTKISPISLRLIRNKEFNKIPKVKFLGFINIIQKTYKIDLNELIEEYNAQMPKDNQNIKITNSKQNNNSTLFMTFLALILTVTGGFLLFKNYNNSKKTLPINEKNISLSTQNTLPKTFKIKKIDKKNSLKKELKTTTFKETNTTSINLKETNSTFTNKETNLTSNKKYKVIIAPNKLLWFMAINIDTNKSIQYLTSHKKILPKGNYYIKFGHGDFNLTYNNQTINPNTKKVIRMLFKNGEYKFMKKPNEFEK